MIRISCIAFILINSYFLAFSQSNGTSSIQGFQESDSISTIPLLTSSQIQDQLGSIPKKKNQFILGGYITSVYREVIDSVEIRLSVDGQEYQTTRCQNGLFYFILDKGGKLVDLLVAHPDFHTLDTSFIFPEGDLAVIPLQLYPKYKILLRGRVYAGNMPLEDVNVRILHLDETYQLVTRGCFYDNEDYWNCLYDGMFKAELTAESPEDSIRIILSREGMKTYEFGMKFNEYTGEIMRFKMKYRSQLPVVPYNDLNLKLGFPFMSMKDDWFVSFSYYRHVRNIKRLAYGIDASMYITNTSQSLATFPELDLSTADSSYINTFIGPSVLFYFIAPEKRMFSSYIGSTFSLSLTELDLIPQVFLGTRIFLDLNKALSLDVRYAEFETDVIEYRFNPFGNASRSAVTENLRKIHATLGIQIVF